MNEKCTVNRDLKDQVIVTRRAAVERKCNIATSYLATRKILFRGIN